MTPTEMAKEVSVLAGITLPEAKKVIAAIAKSMAKALQDKDRIEVRGFGTFKVKYYPPRKFSLDNPKWLNLRGIAYSKPRYRVRFTPSSGLIALLYYDYKGTHDHSPPRSPRKTYR